MLLSIVTYPDSRLSRPAVPVAEITEEIRKLLEDMAETMYAAPGVGLAANQIGDPRRVFTADDGEHGLLKVINPTIVELSGELQDEEGCLSVPGPRAKVKRAQRAVLEGLDPDGKPLRLVGEGLLARIFQHE